MKPQDIDTLQFEDIKDGYLLLDGHGVQWTEVNAELATMQAG